MRNYVAPAFLASFFARAASRGLFLDGLLRRRIRGVSALVGWCWRLCGVGCTRDVLHSCMQRLWPWDPSGGIPWVWELRLRHVYLVCDFCCVSCICSV